MKKHASLLLMALMSVSLVLGGCGKSGSDTPDTKSQTKVQTKVQTGAEAGDQTIVQSGDRTAPGQTSENPSGESPSPTPGSGVDGEPNISSDENKLTCQAAIRVGSLEGPTSTGLVSLMGKASGGETPSVYEFTMASKANELVGKMASGDLDIALVLADVANTLYTKTQGNITVLNINILGVLYVMVSDDSITSMTGLKRRTIYVTRKGTTPEYIINYLLKKNSLPASSVDSQFKSGATEVVSLLKRDSNAIGALSQPFTTATYVQNPDLETVLDLTGQWSILNRDFESMLVTSITLVCGDLLGENRSPVADFIKDYKVLALFAKEHTEDAVQPITRQGVVEKTLITQKALPYYNAAYLTRQEMRNALSGYLSTLDEQDPKSIGGQMPGNDPYYTP